MKTKIAIILNIGIGFATGMLLHTLLPFAEGVACAGAKIQGLPCEESWGAFSRFALSLAPVAVAAILSAAAYGCRLQKPWLSMFLLSVLPISVSIWVSKVWIF